MGPFDLIVIGVGIAGSTASIAAARLGLRVALIQNRSVLGGNSSSEIRVSPVGDINLPPYPAFGAVVAELGSVWRGFCKTAATYDDARKMRVVKAEKNIQPFMNTHAFAAEMRGNSIAAVIAHDLMTSLELRFTAPLFADCTGDGDIGFLAGAEYREPSRCPYAMKTHVFR
jgi:anaerobic glycerol-3-phosphate dehydrogenase